MATMKLVFTLLVCFLIVGLVAYSLTRRRSSFRTAAASQVSVSETYLSMRKLILESLHGKVALPPARKPTEPYAVMMDWNTGNGIATVVAVADGIASIYLSSGGGSIGGGQSHHEIREAALNAMSLAAEFQPRMQPTGTYPLPEPGGVIFYAVTDAGVYSSPATAEELAAQRHPLSRLGNAMQNIVTQYRLLQLQK